MNITITIQEAANLLGYSDSRPLKKWAERKGVPIFAVEGSSKKYMIRMQFEYARLEKFIHYLKDKYKSEWFDFFKAYMSMNVTDVVQIEECGVKIQSFIKRNNYKPSGHNEKRFWDSLTKNVAE